MVIKVHLDNHTSTLMLINYIDDKSNVLTFSYIYYIVQLIKSFVNIFNVLINRGVAKNQSFHNIVKMRNREKNALTRSAGFPEKKSRRCSMRNYQIPVRERDH